MECSMESGFTSHPKSKEEAEALVEKLNSRGREYFQGKHFVKSFLEYKKSLIYCEQYSLSNLCKARAHSNCAISSYKVLETDTLIKDEKLKCLQEMEVHCDMCLELEVTKYLPKAHYYKAEARRLLHVPSISSDSKHDKCAMHHYMESFKLDKNVLALFMAIIFGVTYNQTKRLLQYQMFVETNWELLNKLCEMIVTSHHTQSQHMKFLFISAQNSGFLHNALQQNAEKFTSGLVLKLVQKSSQSGLEPVMKELVNLLLKDESRQETVLREASGQEMCLPILKLLQPTQTLLKVINTKERTGYVLSMIQSHKFQEALMAVKSGKLKEKNICLSDMMDSLLKSENETLVEGLLAAKVNPNVLGHLKQKSPMEILSLRCRPVKTKLEQKQRAVKYMHLLLEYGANVEDLNAYSGGSRTSPLHVATHLALTTGNIEILYAVDKKGDLSWNCDDKEGKTPLQVAEASKSKFHKNVCDFIAAKLTNDCPPHKDEQETVLIPNVSGALDNESRNEDCTTTQPNKTPYDNQPPGVESTVLASPGNTLLADGIEQNVAQQEVEGTPYESSSMQSEQISSSLAKTVSEQVTHISEPSSSINEYELENLTKQDVAKMTETLLTKPDDYFISTEEHQPPSPTHEDSTVEIATAEEIEQEVDSGGTHINADPNKQPPVNLENQTDDNSFEFNDTLWEIELHEDVMKFLKDKTQLLSIRQQAIKKLNKLASGDWNIKLQKSLTDGSEQTIQLYEAKLTKSARIIYQFSIRFSQRETEKIKKLKFETSKPLHIYTQAILVWEVVLNHDRIHHSVQRIKKAIHNTQQVPPQIHALPQPHQEHIGTRVPQLYLDHSILKGNEVTEILKCLTSEPLNCVEGEEDVGAKMYSMSTQLVLGVLNGKHDRRDYPIKVTDEEHDIIKVPESEPVVVLGRSGTGKTTTCLCRLWLKFKAYWDSHTIQEPGIPKVNASFDDTSEEDNQTTEDNTFSESDVQSSTCEEAKDFSVPSDCEHLHQVFITKNYALCAKMKKRFYDFVAGNEPTKEHLLHEKAKLPDKLSDVPDLCYPLFLTARQFFMMLDKSLGDEKQYFKPGDKIVSLDYDQEDKGTLHLLLDDFETDSEEDEEGVQRVKEKRQIKEEVTASTFKTVIWPKISKDCSDEKTDPLLVWMEIQSFIKGSREALKSKDGYVTKEEYLEFGKQQAHNFRLRRDEVYNLFKQYVYLTRHRDIRKHYFDNCDFVKNLYGRLLAVINAKGIPWSIHRMYIDEIQDFTQAELTLLIKLCRDPNGFFLAGDTAQTIIKGISFRFEDLRSLFHELKSSAMIKTKVPELHKLTINHRSHSAITDLASSITDLLKEFFPYSFDWRDIPEDQSNIRGPEPLFLCSKQQLDHFMLLDGKGQSTSSVEFGADQVVIVREEKSKASLPDYLKEEIILSVQECKGLEFNDVLLYNFFKDCPEQSDVWRLSSTFLNFKKHRQLCKRGPYRQVIHPLDFNEAHHTSFGAELKYLYTVVTRAKNHIWIYEDLEPDTLPMLDYWYRRGMVKVVTSNDDITVEQVYSSNVSSTPQDWKRRGDNYAEKQLWEPARRCYQKASEDHLEMLAYANSLTLKALSKRQRVDLKLKPFLQAAFLYIKCDESWHKSEHLLKAAGCLFRAKMYQQSAEIYEKLQHYKHASAIYGRKYLDDLESLVKVKVKMRNYRGAVSAYLSRRKNKSALLLAYKYKDELDLQGKPYPKLITTAFIQIKECLHNNALTNVWEYIMVIPDVSQQVHLLKRARLYFEACQVLLRHKMYADAYRLLSAQGMYEKGIEVAKANEDLNKINEFVLQKATKHISSGQTQFDPDTQKELEKMHTSKDHKLKARACFFLSMNLLDIEGDLGKASKLCICAWEIYKDKLQDRVGEIEAFHLLSHIREKRKESTLTIVKDTIHTISTAEEVCDLLRKPTATLTTSLKDIENFYGLQKQGSITYCIPEGQELCVKLSHECAYKSNPVDSDGMLQLDRKETLQQVGVHLRKYVSKWKEDLKVAGDLWQRRMRLSFPFHYKVIESEVKYLQESHRQFPPGQIDQYLQMCELALQVNKLTPNILQPATVSIPLQRLLSPFSQLSLQFQKENYMVLSKSDIFREMIFKPLIDHSLKTATQLDEPPNVDNWLKVWRFLSILGSSKVTEINYAISKQKYTVNRLSQRNRKYNPARNPPHTYVYVRRNNCHEHFFTMWIWSCKLIREGNKALIAIKMCFLYFIQVIARRTSLQKISTENLVNILSVHSTALLAMISGSDLTVNHETKFFVPESFEVLTQTFDMLNCEESSHTKLLVACIQTSQTMNAQKLKNGSVQILRAMLDLLLGKYRRTFSPLKMAMSYSQQNTFNDTIHCLVLTLTLFGNLALSGFITAYEAQYLQQDILNVLEHAVTNKNHEKSQHLIAPYFGLASCTNAKGIFDVVLQLLRAVNVNANIRELRAVKSLGKQQIRFKACSFHRFPTVSVQWQIIYKTPHHIHVQNVSQPQQQLSPYLASPQKASSSTEGVTPPNTFSVQTNPSHPINTDHNEQGTSQTHQDSIDGTNHEGSEDRDMDDEEDTDDKVESEVHTKSIHSDSGDELNTSDSEGEEMNEREIEDGYDTNDEDVLKEVSAAVEAIYDKPTPGGEIDTELEREMEAFLNENQCVICDHSIGNEAPAVHFKGEHHMQKSGQYRAYCETLDQYKTLQSDLQGTISKCKQTEHNDYDYEKQIMEAEKLLRDNNEHVHQIEQACDWENGKKKLEEVYNTTLPILISLLKPPTVSKNTPQPSTNAGLNTEDDENNEEIEEEHDMKDILTLPRKKRSMKEKHNKAK